MPKSSRRVTVHPIALRELWVARISDVTPGLRRVTLSGDQLGAFTSANSLVQSALRSDGFDDDIRLIFPYPGRTDPVLPIQREGHLQWPKDPRVLSKVYTVRRFDPEAGELDVDFVRHGTGTATSWAYRAQPGDRIHIAGPAASHALPDADWLLVAGDDTALPAISRLLEQLPTDAKGQVFVEIAHADHQLQLRKLDGVSVTWLIRDGIRAGTSTLLIDAVQSAHWWDGSAFAWIAGESSTVKTIRRHLVDERGMDKHDVQFTGYWRHGEVVTLDDDPAVPDPERNEEAFETLHELGELLPPFAMRTAVTLGIPELISRGITSPEALAAACGGDPVGVGKMLRYLTAINLLDNAEPGHYRLSEIGEYLTDDFVVEVLHEDGYHARREVAYHGLTEAIRTGTEAYTQATGTSYKQLLSEDWYATKHHDHNAEFAGYIAEPLARSDAVAGIDHLLIRADAPAVFAAAILGADPHLLITIAGLPSHLTRVRDDLATTIGNHDDRKRVVLTEHSLFETTAAADAILLVDQLGGHGDADAAHALRQATTGLAPGGRILVIEHLLHDEHDEHQTEADLLAYSLHGSGIRTPDDLHAVFTAAGLRPAGTQTIGWDTTVHVLTL
jgi:NADPH-dependent ferric siderophore reductase